MSTLKYTDDHEWIQLESDDIAVVGITDYAQERLGELVFIELPEPGRELAKGEDAAVIESVKSASELKSPVSGRVLKVNDALNDNPILVNKDAQGKGWFFKIELTAPEELDTLMDETTYRASLN